MGNITSFQTHNVNLHYLVSSPVVLFCPSNSEFSSSAMDSRAFSNAHTWR